MAQDPSLAYADYFAAAGGVGTLVPEVDAGEDDGQLYGGVHAHDHGLDMFGASRGLVPGAMVDADAHGKAAAALGDFAGLDEHHHRLGGHGQAPLTSLSLHGPAEAASLALHHHQLGGALRQQHQAAAWPPSPLQHQGGWHLRGSRFLRPTQQLLQEFCGLPVEASSAAAAPKPPTTKPASEDGAGEGSSSSSAPSAQIQAMDAAELQRLKAKLYAMLREVERRYRRYREQMRAVAGSFEAVAGERAAAAYTRLASRTISKHFRSLRDGVAAQMQVVRRALGEKDADGGGVPAAGMAKGETTPRLRVLDQCLRQHRAYHSGVLQSQPWRPQRGLPERAVSILRAWLFEHFLHPYPSDVDKHILARQTGLSRSQVSNWFINARVRLWKPMVEEMYAEEMKDQQQQEGVVCSNAANNANNPSSYSASEVGQGRGGGASGADDDGAERKPTRAQLLVHDAGSLASVVSIGSSSSSRGPQDINFGMMDGHIDFGAYNDDHAAGHGFGGGGVSLTLGLHPQHAGDDPHGGVNVAFAAAPSAAHEFMFMAGVEQQQQMVAGGGGVHGHLQGQFGAGMEGDAVAASYYHHHRGLSAATGFQLLHDLAG